MRARTWSRREVLGWLAATAGSLWLGPLRPDPGLAAPAGAVGPWPAALEAEVSTAYANPYDPKIVEVWGEFSGPSGIRMIIQGFVFQPYEFKIVNDRLTGFVPVGVIKQSGRLRWLVRFSPTERGVWRYRLYVRDRRGKRRAGEGRIEADALPRFVRVGTGPRHWYLDQGDSAYVPVGENLGWYDRGLVDDVGWLQKLGHQGANFIRAWMCDWAYGIEWSDTGLGDYSRRQDRAFQLDYLLLLCRKNNVRCQLSLDSYGELSTKINPAEWDNNPYNVALGGPCASPGQFFTDPRARELYRRRLRYIVARWSAFPEIVAWELFNEVDLTDDYNEVAVADWHREMARYIRTIDPYKHPITTSLSNPFLGSLVWSLPEVDYTQLHAYNFSDSSELIHALVEGVAAYRDTYQKPVLVGEFGISSAAGGQAADPQGISLRDGLWSGLMAGGLGSGMTWWWDNWVDTDDLYGAFGSLARFLDGVDFAGEELVPEQIQVTGEGLMGLALRGRRLTLVWIKDLRATWSAGYPPVLVTGARAILSPDAVPARVRWWDVTAGRGMGEGRVDSPEVKVPPFRDAVAAKLERQR